MSISNCINWVVEWFADFTQGDIVAIVILIAAIALGFSTIKTALKVIMVIVGFLAVTYLVAPDIYAYAMVLVEKIIGDFTAFFASL